MAWLVASAVVGGAGASLYGYSLKKEQTEGVLCEAASIPTHGVKVNYNRDRS